MNIKASLASTLLLLSAGACRPGLPTLSDLDGGTIIDNGGDLIRCRAAPDADNVGDFTLDYILTYDPTIGTSRDPSASDWPELEARLRRVVGEKLPDMLPSLATYLSQLEASDPAGTRVWHGAPAALADLQDEDILGHIPDNCLAERRGELVPDLRQLVRRRFLHEAGVTKVHYYYDADLLTRLRLTLPLQYSYLIVHEWLWDYADSTWANRSVNRLLHDTATEAMTPAEVRQAVRSFGVDGSEGRYIGGTDPSLERVRSAFADEAMCDYSHRSIVDLAPEAGRVVLAPRERFETVTRIGALEPGLGTRLCGFAFAVRLEREGGGAARVVATLQRGLDIHPFDLNVTGATERVEIGACADLDCNTKHGSLQTMVYPDFFGNSRWTLRMENQGPGSLVVIMPYLTLVKMVSQP